MKKNGQSPLRAYREQHGLTCEQLGKRLGFAASTIRSFENGNRIVSAEDAVMIETRIGIDRAVLRADLFAERRAA